MHPFLLFFFLHHLFVEISYLQVKDDFAFSLFDLDWDVFSQHIDGAINRIPIIGETGVKSTVCGPGNFSTHQFSLSNLHTDPMK